MRIDRCSLGRCSIRCCHARSKSRVGPDGMMIVPLGEQERGAIVNESQSLIEQVERAIGYQPPR